MEDFFKVRFRIWAKGKTNSEILEEIISFIRDWLIKKYTSPKVYSIVSDWKKVAYGSIFGDPEKQGEFCIESIRIGQHNDISNLIWACRITEYPKPISRFKPRKWITEITFNSTERKNPEVSYIVKYYDIPGYGGISLKLQPNIPTVAKAILSNTNWQCFSNGIALNPELTNYYPNDEPLLNYDSCLALRKDYIQDEIQDEIIPKENHWISLCKVNRQDRNNDIWMLRLADSIGGTLIAPDFDETKEQIFENRRLIYREDGPNTPDAIGFWEWREQQSESGRWKTEASYIEDPCPIEIFILDTHSGVNGIIELLNGGIEIPAYMQSNILFAVKKDTIIEGLLCDYNTLKSRSAGESKVITLKEDVYTLAYYELSEEDIFTWRNRLIYKNISLGEPQRMIPVQKITDTLKQLFLSQMNWQSFKAMGFIKNDWKKLKEFLASIPDDTILEHLAVTYHMSPEEANACVSSFLQSIEDYIFVEDVDSTLITQMLVSHAGLKELCDKSNEKMWREEHSAEIETAKKELEAIHLKAKKDTEAATEKLQEIEKELTAAEGKRLSALRDVDVAKEQLNHLLEEIAQNKALGNDTLTAVRKKIADAQNDMADFIAELTPFLPQQNRSAYDWYFSPSSETIYSEDDFELTDNWENEFDLLIQNLASSMQIEPYFASMLAAFLYSTHINHAPIIIAGPAGINIADTLSVTLYSRRAGHLILGDSFDPTMPEKVKEDADQIITVQNMFTKGWNDTLPQAFHSSNQHIVWTHPFVEDLLMEPKGLFNYMFPAFSENFICARPSDNLIHGKRSSSFVPFKSKKKQTLSISEIKKLGVSKFLLQQLCHVLADAKNMLDNPSSDADLEILFGLLPLSVLTGKTNILSNVIESKTSISTSVKDEIKRYIEEE